MDTNKVIVTLLILTIVLSVATVAFNLLSGGGKVLVAKDMKSGDTATVGLNIEGPNSSPQVTKTAQLGLYVEGN